MNRWRRRGNLRSEPLPVLPGMSLTMHSFRPQAPPGRSQDAAPADLELLRGVARQDRAAFEQLYTRYHLRLTRFLMRLTDNYGTAEEVVNDTMFVVWQKAATFREGSAVSTWIIGIAYRRALKTLKRGNAARHNELSEDELPALEGDLGEELSREQRDWLLAGFVQLSLEHRMALLLTYYMGHSCEDIAAIADCPVNTVKTRLFHARARLRALLPELADPVRSAAPTEPSR